MNDPVDTALRRRDFLRLGLVLLPAFRMTPQNVSTMETGTRYLNYSEAEPLVGSGKLPLPPGLAGLSRDAMSAAWEQWIRNRDLETRSRLQRGEEDTLANFVLLGVSFTDSPRITRDIRDSDEADTLIRARVQSFVDAVAAPGNNERLLLLSRLITRLGYSAANAEQRERLAEFVMENVSRYLAEERRYESTVDLVVGNDTAPAITAASSLYRDRGLSVDTDFRSSYAIEAALAEVRRRGLLRQVRRVAIIGPGLDFTDKNAGFDHYPLQTLQPFAVVDSLVRLGLSTVSSLHVSILEISVPAFDHITQAVTKARAGQPYTIQLVLDRSRSWDEGALTYWRRLGTAIGTPAEPAALPPQVGNADRRAITIRPDTGRLLEPIPLNVVHQRRVGSPEQRYDLIVGTNVLIYYDAFEQALALLNVESMLAQGGVFLTNDLTAEYPGVRLRPAATVRAIYSQNQADQVQIYLRSTFPLQMPPN